MYQKGNLYYADWRDKKGVRRRKSFSTMEEAEHHEAPQKRTARPKKQRGGLRSKPPSRPSQAKSRTNTGGKSPIRSSKSREGKRK